MEMMLPVASWHPNALDPGVGRVLSYEPILPDECIAEYLERMCWDAAIDRPSKVFIDGQFVPREQWFEPLRDVRTFSVHAALQGDDSDIGQAIMAIVIAVAAFYTGGAAATAFGSQLAGAAVSAAVMMGGTLLMNSIYGPDGPQDNGQGKDNPTYSVTGGSNSVRPYDPLPVLIGRMRVFPDIDEKPFVYFDGEDQYLHQTFNFGLGNLYLSDMRIGDTPVENLNIEKLEQTTVVTDVDTAEGNTLKFSDGWITRSSPVNTVEIAVDLAGVLVSANKKGELSNLAADFSIEISPYGQNTWTTAPLPAVQLGFTPDAFETVVATDPSTPPPGVGWTLVDDPGLDASGP